MPKHVLAAGGVVWRETADAGTGTEVALVHRPKYDDWSLPKGKSDPGEHPIVTARREVEEETGLDFALAERLPRRSYPLRCGDLKIVDYWAMRYLGGEFVANAEVDAMQWLPIEDALTTASNDDSVATLHAFAAAVRPSSLVLLVRHARAGKKSRWDGADRLRPLDRSGRHQANRLRDTLPVWRPDRVAAADRTRCEETVAPLAESLGLPVQSEPALTEELFSTTPLTGLARLREYARLPGASVICSQGGVIPGLITEIADHDGIDVADPPSAKGSVWVLGFAAGALVSADYYRDFRALEHD